MGKIPVKAYKKGTSGNPKGRPKGLNETERLKEAIKRAKKRNKVDLIDHFCNVAYIDNRVLIALMKKLVPDKREEDLNLKAAVTIIIIDRYDEKSKKCNNSNNNTTDV